MNVPFTFVVIILGTRLLWLNTASVSLFLNTTRHKWVDKNCCFNFVLAIHDNCPLLSLQLMYFGGLYCKQLGPRSDCSLRSSLIRVHSVCFHDKIRLACIYLCSRHIKQTTVSGWKNISRIRINFFLVIFSLVICDEIITLMSPVMLPNHSFVPSNVQYSQALYSEKSQNTCRERSGSVVECSTQKRGAAGSSLTWCHCVVVLEQNTFILA